MTNERPRSAHGDQLPELYRGLQSLEIRNFRNIQTAELQFSHGLNLIDGQNASGKTSLLEAIHTLGRVRSFRTHSAQQIIRYGQASFRLVGWITNAGGSSIPIGIERGVTALNVHLAGEPVRRLSDLAGYFPVQLLSSDTSNLFNGGPRHRRQVLDWALFHVEQGYRDIWQRYARILKQRNAALRSRASPALITAWDAELIEEADAIDHLRRDYLARITGLLSEELHYLLPENELELRYFAGWPAGRTLSESLSAALDRDRRHGYTHYGVHRSDFRLLFEGRDLAAHFSRGQQKTVMVGFMLAQVRLQQARACPAGAFLLDDLTSELDRSNQQRVLQALRELDAQVFITTVAQDHIDTAGWQAMKRFHVKHGVIQEVL